MMYDVCIVGAGMVGSAAARHATLTSGVSVCLIGPTEPESKSGKDDRDIYGSYYDEGRITRCCDRDLVWATLAKESIKRYRDIEHQSGIKFYHSIGSLMTGEENSEFLQDVEDVTFQHKIDIEKLTFKTLQDRFPYMNISRNASGILEINNAGYINPRKMVEAQKKMAAIQGCAIIDDVVRRVTRIVQPDGRYAMQVDTEKGSKIQSKRVLLATGAFTNFRNLLTNVKPDQLLAPLNVSLVEVDEKSLTKLSEMPCVIYKGPAHENWQVPSFNRGKEVAFYMLPPIQYPDGRYYLKLGFFHGARMPLKSLEEVKKWFDTGDPKIEESVAKFTISLFKGITFKSIKGDSCVITETPTTRPYIDMVHAQLGVAIGCNGYAAKSSDEIGRLAANIILGYWNSELPRDIFRLWTLPRLSEEFPSSPKSNL